MVRDIAISWVKPLDQGRIWECGNHNSVSPVEGVRASRLGKPRKKGRNRRVHVKSASDRGHCRARLSLMIIEGSMLVQTPDTASSLNTKDTAQVPIAHVLDR